VSFAAGHAIGTALELASGAASEVELSGMRTFDEVRARPAETDIDRIEEDSVTEDAEDGMLVAMDTDPEGMEDAVGDKLAVTDELAIADEIAPLDELSITDGLAVADETAAPDGFAVTDELATTGELAIIDELAVIGELAIDMTRDVLPCDEEALDDGGIDVVNKDGSTEPVGLEGFILDNKAEEGPEDGDESINPEEAEETVLEDITRSFPGEDNVFIVEEVGPAMLEGETDTMPAV